jgi:Eukaryotic protein of unknown function (DUF846)
MYEIPPTAPLTDAAGLAQAASFTVYILSGIFGLGFITTFVICIVSLMLDFWTVRRCTQPCRATCHCFLELVPSFSA